MFWIQIDKIEQVHDAGATRQGDALDEQLLPQEKNEDDRQHGDEGAWVRKN